MYRFTYINQLFCSVLVVIVQFGLNYEKYCQQLIKQLTPETAPSRPRMVLKSVYFSLIQSTLRSVDCEHVV